MKVRITAPVAGLNGPGVGGIKFTDSVAETDNQAIADYCRSAGYKVEKVGDSPKAKTSEEPKAPAKKAPAKKAAAKKAPAKKA